MVDLFVTTTSDTVAADGVLSLREAVATATAGDTIAFKGIVPIFTLALPLVIDRSLTIDGGGYALNQIRGGIISGQIVIGAGANVTIRQMVLTATDFGRQAQIDGQNGEHGTNGDDGRDGSILGIQPGGNGGDGSAGNDGTAPRENGLGLFGTIINDGRLTLDYSRSAALPAAATGQMAAPVAAVATAGAAARGAGSARVGAPATAAAAGTAATGRTARA